MDNTNHNDRATGALVIYRDQATLFGAVGTPVPADARMGVAEAAAAAAIARTVPIRTAPTQSPAAPARFSALRLAGAPVR